MLTTQGTPAVRAAIRPNTPGFGLWVCTRSKRSRRKIRRSSWNARTSARGSQLRVALGHGTNLDGSPPRTGEQRFDPTETLGDDDQGARAATHELQVTPLAERWVP